MTGAIRLDVFARGAKPVVREPLVRPSAPSTVAEGLAAPLHASAPGELQQAPRVGVADVVHVLPDDELLDDELLDDELLEFNDVVEDDELVVVDELVLVVVDELVLLDDALFDDELVLLADVIDPIDVDTLLDVAFVPLAVVVVRVVDAAPLVVADVVLRHPRRPLRRPHPWCYSATPLPAPPCWTSKLPIILVQACEARGRRN